MGGVIEGYLAQNPGSNISLKSEAKKATAACEIHRQYSTHNSKYGVHTANMPTLMTTLEFSSEVKV